MILVVLVIQENKETQDQLVLPGHLDQRVQLVIVELLEIEVKLGLEVLQGTRDLLVQQELPEHRACQGRKVKLANQDLRDLLDSMETVDKWANLDQKETRETLVLVENKVNQAR